MSTFIFHNNLHRFNHHTVALSGFPDSASDPIASKSYPFLGSFHNNYYDLSGNYIGTSESYNWASNYTLTFSNSAKWGLYPTTYSTVKPNSASWTNGFYLHKSTSPLSAKWISTYTTFYQNVDRWNSVVESNNVYSNEVQEYTAQKTFSALEIKPADLSNITWDLTAGQVAFFVGTTSANFSGFSGAKRGGIYNLVVVTDTTCNPNLSVRFNSDKFKIDGTKTLSKSGINLAKFSFVSDGNVLIGKSTEYNITPPDRDVYYSSDGILLFENGIQTNPITLDDGETLSPLFAGGIIVQGVEPYDSGTGVLINNTQYSRDFIFSFTTLSALSASSPYGELGSMDKVSIIDPNITIVSPTIPVSSIQLKRCGAYGGIDIRAKSFGYISQLIINDVEIKDFVFKPDGYQYHETGHYINIVPDYNSVRVQSYFIEYSKSAPNLPHLSSGIAMWVDAMDYSTVNFKLSSGVNYVTGLSSKIANASQDSTKVASFSSLSTYKIEYNTSPKQSIKYDGQHVPHTSSLVISGLSDAVTFTVFTPKVSSSNTEWIWANGNYGIFKIPNKYAIGIGTSTSYYTYNYGSSNANTPLCVATKYLSSNKAQAVYINSGNITATTAVTADFSNGYTAIGGLNPSSGYSNCAIHEIVFYGETKSNANIKENVDYLLDKWKFL